MPRVFALSAIRGDVDEFLVLIDSHHRHDWGTRLLFNNDWLTKERVDFFNGKAFCAKGGIASDDFSSRVSARPIAFIVNPKAHAKPRGGF